MGDFIGTTISGMTGRGSIRHNNRSFSAANIDRSRTEQNVTYCNDDLKQVYHEIFDEALAAYNAKKKKTRDKITDYYEHIRQGKQEKLFHEAIFQIGNLEDCGCGSPGGERAAAALKEFAESFQERNPHLRVFNMAELEKQRKALQGTVRRLQAAEKVRVDLEAIQPERTLTGAVRGVTVEQVEDLKAAAIRGTVAEHDVRELKEENRQLRSRLPSVKEQLKEAEEQQRLLNENYDLRVEVEYLTESLNSERDFSSRLLEGIGAVLDFLDRHLPEQFRPLVEKARELLPVPELQQPEQEQERGHTWGGMEL